MAIADIIQSEPGIISHVVGDTRKHPGWLAVMRREQRYSEYASSFPVCVQQPRRSRLQLAVRYLRHQTLIPMLFGFVGYAVLIIILILRLIFIPSRHRTGDDWYICCGDHSHSLSSPSSATVTIETAGRIFRASVCDEDIICHTKQNMEINNPITYYDRSYGDAVRLIINDVTAFFSGAILFVLVVLGSIPDGWLLCDGETVLRYASRFL